MKTGIIMVVVYYMNIAISGSIFDYPNWPNEKGAIRVDKQYVWGKVSPLTTWLRMRGYNLSNQRCLTPRQNIFQIADPQTIMKTVLIMVEV